MTGTEALAALADIELPMPPAWPSIILIGTSLLIIAAAGGVLYYSRRRRSGGVPSIAEELTSTDEARRRLEGLRVDWVAGNLHDREASYRLCALLRIGLDLPQLDSRAPPAAIQPRHDWISLLEELQRLRYARKAPHLTANTFERARELLESHRTPGARDHV